MLPEQCRAARAMIGLSQADLAAQASVSVPTIKNFERGASVPYPNNLTAIQAALEKAGVEFIDQNGGGAGVRFIKPKAKRK